MKRRLDDERDNQYRKPARARSRRQCDFTLQSRSTGKETRNIQYLQKIHFKLKIRTPMQKKRPRLIDKSFLAVLEKKLKMLKVYDGRTTDDGRRTPHYDNSSLEPLAQIQDELSTLCSDNAALLWHFVNETIKCQR
ncbi:hypothetical protein FSP39_017147 [Pinctada imbricata]|uniref:Uncharacterized protein n=1 Tax=Pinctada imbricata TaxID=66713 RepID=A0AA89C913_PINIB|nr:hypothetical protein FSP39_017147 [Pinctada imbricata]